MTTITILKKQVSDDRVIILDVVDLDGEKFFHVHGLKRGIKVDHRINVNDSDWPCKQAQDLYDYYTTLI